MDSLMQGRTCLVIPSPGHRPNHERGASINVRKTHILCLRVCVHVPVSANECKGEGGQSLDITWLIQR